MDLITQLPVPDRDTRLALNKNFAVLEVEDEKDDARLNREIQDRQAADVNLQGQINALRTRLSTAESNISNLQTRMSTAEEQIKKLEETVYGMPSALLNEASSIDDDENDNQPLQEINTERNGILHAE
ncbi:hypothetical protein [Limosilactobacillus vaginalis]|uniref:hypothetical protein n=1 Tax=Limosilactobacillus vaginalis TaxID=1633 RepID=UPI00388FFD45